MERETQQTGKPLQQSNLVESMKDEGWALVKSDVVDAGEWNERFFWQAVKGDQVVDLDSVMKSDRVKWKDCFENFHCKCLGMSFREWEDLALCM